MTPSSSYARGSIPRGNVPDRNGPGPSYARSDLWLPERNQNSSRQLDDWGGVNRRGAQMDQQVRYNRGDNSHIHMGNRASPDFQVYTNGDSIIAEGPAPRYRAVSKKKPATYDGQSSLQDYLVQFELLAEINGWDDFTKAMELATSLRGQAQGVLSDLRPDLRRDYSALVNALTARFEPVNQTELYRAQMKKPPPAKI